MFGFGTTELIVILLSTVGFAFLIWTTVYVVHKARKIRGIDSSIPKPWIFACIHLFLILILTSLYSVVVERPVLIYSLIGLTVYGWVPLYLILTLRKLKNTTPLETQDTESSTLPISSDLPPQFAIDKPKSKFGGWIRMWIVFTVIWGALVVGYISATTPSIFSLQAFWDEKIKAEEAKIEEMINFEIGKSGKAKEEVRKRVIFNYMAFDGKLFEYNDLREKDINQYWSRVISSAIIWLGTSIVVFLCGWAVGWINRGFSKEHPK